MCLEKEGKRQIPLVSVLNQSRDVRIIEAQDLSVFIICNLLILLKFDKFHLPSAKLFYIIFFIFLLIIFIKN